MGVKYAVDQKFFDSWNYEMSYVLGFWYADGSVENSIYVRGQYVRVGCTDKDIISHIKNLLKADHKINITNRGPNKTYYLLRIGDKKLFKKLIELGVSERKSKTISLPNVPERFFSDFLRGYFDGDGCVYLEKDKCGNCKRLTTVLTSGSKEFLVQISNYLHINHNLSSKKISLTKNNKSVAYQLRYSSRDSIKLYNIMYSSTFSSKVFMKRKRKIFLDYFKLKNVQAYNMTKILDSKGPIFT